MNVMEINNGVVAVLVAGIVFFLCGLIGMNLVGKRRRSQRPAIAIAEVSLAEPAGGAPKPAASPPIAPLLATADEVTGESTAKKLCSSCDTFTDGDRAGVGPNLYGVVGGRHGHMEGFNYTAGIKAKIGSGTFDELNGWLHWPLAYMPGTRMAFAGINNDQQRADVIDYLRSLWPNPVPMLAP